MVLFSISASCSHWQASSPITLSCFASLAALKARKTGEKPANAVPTGRYFSSKPWIVPRLLSVWFYCSEATRRKSDKKVGRTRMRKWLLHLYLISEELYSLLKPLWGLLDQAPRFYYPAAESESREWALEGKGREGTLRFKCRKVWFFAKGFARMLVASSLILQHWKQRKQWDFAKQTRGTLQRRKIDKPTSWVPEEFDFFPRQWKTQACDLIVTYPCNIIPRSIYLHTVME